MDKLTKFAKLDEMGITRAEMEEYFRAKEQKQPNAAKVTPKNSKTPLPLVYKSAASKDDVLCFEYGLSLDRKDAVWGIAVDGVWVKLKNEPSNDLRKARAYCKEHTTYSYGYKCIPGADVMLEIARNIDKFNATVGILRRHGIEADVLSGEYVVESGWFWHNKMLIDVDSQTKRYVTSLKPDMHIRIIHTTAGDFSKG